MNIATMLETATAILALGALIAVFFTARSVQRSRRQCEALESNLAALRREIELIASISVRTGRRVQRVASEFSGVAERIESFETRVAGGAPDLDQAIELARRGARPDRLEQQFGLSRGEADLVSRLHGGSVRRPKLN
jgi:type II secretory pathway component PulJ